MKVLFIVITLITFLIFMIEGVLHYNVGLKNNKNCNQEQNKNIKILNYVIPEKKEILMMSITVLIFSSVSGLLTAYVIKHHLNENDK